MSLWPFGERRRNARHSVEWEASLCCVFSDFEKTISVRVIEISHGGAKLSLEGMRVGPYHLTVGGDGTARFELSIPKPEGTIKSLIDFQWYNFDEGTRLFTTGVAFLGLDKESEAVLKTSLKRKS